MQSRSSLLKFRINNRKFENVLYMGPVSLVAFSTCAGGSPVLEVQQISNMLCPKHYVEITGRDGTANSGLLDFFRANDLLLHWPVKQRWSQNKFSFFFLFFKEKKRVQNLICHSMESL